jgi:hypothetical protein
VEWLRIGRAINIGLDHVENVAAYNALAMKIKGAVDCKIKIESHNVKLTDSSSVGHTGSVSL